MNRVLNALRANVSGQPESGKFTYLAIVVLALVGAAIPFLAAGEPFLLMMASYAVIAAIVALSLDLLTGNTGLLSFGHAAWYGFGAYVTGLMSKSVSSDFVILLPLVIFITVVFSALVGAILARQVGKTFAILTLAFSQIIFATVFVFSEQTGGEDGLQGIPIPTFFGFQIYRADVWFWVLYGVLILSLLAAFHVRLSPLGKAWLAIRDNADRASFIGMNVIRLKLYSYTASATLASLAGALFVLFNGAASPDMLHWFESGKILMYVVLGGVGTLFGPVLGAVVFTFAEHYVSSATESWLIYFGGLFVFIVIVAPGGILGAIKAIWKYSFGSGKGADQ